MKPGEQYVVPADEGEHAGHVVTVSRVREDPRSTGPDLNYGGPDVVWVRCECGQSWSFEDRP